MSKKRNKRQSITDQMYEQHPEYFEESNDSMKDHSNKLNDHFSGASRGVNVNPKSLLSVEGRTKNQQKYIDDARKSDITFCLAPAGTGKTFIAAFLALEALANGEVEEVIITRPAVGGQEQNGFLPGGIDEKLGPHMAPVIGHLEKILGNGEAYKGREQLKKLREAGVVRILPFEYMRGTDLDHAFVIGDELQNATHEQVKMLLTRISEGSKFLLVGDPEQTDLQPEELSGFAHAATTIGAENIPGISFVEMGDEDVVRHHLIGPMLKALRENPPIIPDAPTPGQAMPTPAQNVAPQHKPK